MKRRVVLAGMAALTTAPLFTAGSAQAEETAEAYLPGPPTVTPADIDFPRRPLRLRYGSAAEASLVPEHLAQMVPTATQYMQTTPPSFPGAVILAARHGVIAEHSAIGHALRYSSWDAQTKRPVELPVEDWVPMARDTIFDMASVTKLFTSVLATQLITAGDLDPDAPVVEYVPEFASVDPAKAAIRINHLYRHISGQIAFINMYNLPDNQARMQAIYAKALQREPGSGYEYSDLNLIMLAEVMSRITGSALDTMVAERITGPLGMSDTGFNPPTDKLHRIAATEYQPWTGRGMIRGSVHDENAWSFGGVAGHAGIFSTARDLAVFGQMVLNGGAHDGERVLSQDAVRLMITNTNQQFGESAGRGIGWQVDQRFFMDALTSPVSVGHTGYTGTCITVDPLSGSVFVLLANRVHPTRDWGAVSTYRRGPARVLARSIAVDAPRGRTAWFSGQQDATTVTLTATPAAVVEAGELEFRLWYDTETTDKGQFSVSTDGQTWTPVPLELRAGRYAWSAPDGGFSGFEGRQWCVARAALPPGVSALRWTYQCDTVYQGRGIYVDSVRIRDGRKLVFNSERSGDAARFEAVGWSQARD